MPMLEIVTPTTVLSARLISLIQVVVTLLVTTILGVFVREHGRTVAMT